MALTSTLFTGLSGLDVNQARLNVVGNNIANVNTVAFKSSRALFRPQFYVTDSAGGAPDGSFGGTNPSQRGLGAIVAGIEKNFAPGALQPTGKATDLAVVGGGFFVVQGKEQLFTRDGSFSRNSDNMLVNGNGDYVQGFAADANGNIITGQLQNISIPINLLTKAKATENITFRGTLNSNGPLSNGASILDSPSLTTAGGTTPALSDKLIDLRDPGDLLTPLFAAGDTLSLAGKRGTYSPPTLDWTIDANSTLADLTNFFDQGLGIDTSVTVAGAPTPGATVGAIAGDAANTARLIIVGNVGSENALSLTGNAFTIGASGSLAFTDGEDAGGNVSNPVGESQQTSAGAYDSLGTPLNINLTVFLEDKTAGSTTWRFIASSSDDTDAATFDPANLSAGLLLGSGTLTFDSSGQLSASTGTTIQIDRENTGAASPLTIKLDFSSMNALAIASSSSTIQEAGQDGQSVGTLTDFSIGQDGSITGLFTNGLQSTLGQVALATFDNPQGLQDKGGNLYATGSNSGQPVISSPLSGGAGEVRSGSLELSNVDLSEEFINMIISSTGFAAASRVINTSDQLIQDLLNSSR